MQGISGSGHLYIAYIPSHGAPQPATHGGGHAPAAGAPMKGDTIRHSGGVPEDTSDFLPDVAPDTGSGDATRRGGGTGGKRQSKGDANQALQKLLDELLALLQTMHAPEGAAPARLSGDMIGERASQSSDRDPSGDSLLTC